jgi:hypothetical protein
VAAVALSNPQPAPNQPLGAGTYDDLAQYNAQGHPIGGKAPFPTKQQQVRMGRRADVAYAANLRQQAFNQRQAAYQQAGQAKNAARLGARRKAIAARVAARQRVAYTQAGIAAGGGALAPLFKGVNQAQNSLLTMPQPGGIGFLLFAILVLLFFLVPVGIGQEQNKTRANLAYDVLAGNAELAPEEDLVKVPKSQSGNQNQQTQQQIDNSVNIMAAATPLTNAGLLQNSPRPRPGTTQVGSAEAITTVQPWQIPGYVTVPGTIETPL